MSNRKGTGRSFFTGSLIGGLIGAVIAVWIAPRSGKETREALLGRGQDVADQMRRQVETITGESLEESLEAGKAEARRLNNR